MAGTHSAGFEVLPTAVHLHVLSFLPLVERARCGLVARSWAELLTHPAFWAELRFDGVAPCSITEETLEQLYRRAGRHLRSLDVSDPACDHHIRRDVVDNLASDGFGLSLESLRTWRPCEESWCCLPVGGHIAPDRLLAACPALASAAVTVVGSLERVAADLRALPGPGLKRVHIGHSCFRTPPTTTAVSLSDLADCLPAALAASSVDELHLWNFTAAAPDRAAHAAREERAAAQRLAEALVAPEGGVRLLRIEKCSLAGATPLLESLCRALAAGSSLLELRVGDGTLTGASVAAVAAALAPGRSRLQRLSLGSSPVHLDLSDGGGGTALFNALGANRHLTELDIKNAELGGAEAAAALASSLRSNGTLRTLSIDGAGELGPGMRLILAALSGSEEHPSECGITSLSFGGVDLDLPACEALREALPRGVVLARGLEARGAASRLSRLDLVECGLGDPAAEALGRALAAQGVGGALRELNLNENNISPVGAAGLAKGIRVCLSLESLDISSNRIGPEGAAALAAAISGTGGSAHKLSTLDITVNAIGDAGVAAMLEAGLGRNASLSELEVGFNGLREEGCMALARWVEARFFPQPQDAPPAHRTRSRTTATAVVGGAAALRPGGSSCRMPPAELLSDRAAPLELRMNSVAGELESMRDAFGRIKSRVNAAADESPGWRRVWGSRSALTFEL